MRTKLLLAFLSVLVFTVGSVTAQEPRWWPDNVEAALAKAGGNRKHLEKSLAAAPKEQRAGIAFLIVNMPMRDLTSISSDLLTTNLDLAYRARDQFPWGKNVPHDLFLNDVLPYASVTETRESWRAEMLERCRPLVADCKTITEAAQALNQHLFAKVKVRYSTKRERPDQSPSESIKIGMASCTGLSILLVDACRSVGIPARVAGIPKWVNKPGNHTWVEIWDGDWHFTGACEFARNGLDHTWFAGDAALAKKDTIENAIYASSFKRTATRFPFPWAASDNEVYAENVTERYTRSKKPVNPVTRLLVRVWGSGKSERIVAHVRVVEAGDSGFVRKGVSKGETADTNDALVFEVPRNRQLIVQVGLEPAIERRIATEDRESVLVDVELSAPAAKKSLTEDQTQRVFDASKKFFDDDAKIDASLDDLLKIDEDGVRRAAWRAYAASSKHVSLKADFEKKLVKHEGHTSPYVVKYVGKKPATGWPLFIAMHGGGGAPKAVNDSQWGIMQKYYRDQESVGGYAYLALRAPNDAWNGFYDLYCCPLVANLIRQFVLFGDVDPNKVFLMGYSHGGYGAFYIGPKMPDRFAAIHSSAAAQTAGTISAKNLRNTSFTFMIGENDTAYGRRKLCESFAAEIEQLRKDNPGEYPVAMEFQKGFGHGGLPDRDKIKDMVKNTRNPVPKKLTWEPTDNLLKDHFYASIDAPVRGQRVDVAVDGNRVAIRAEKVDNLSLWLDRRLVDVDRPVEVVFGGVKTAHEVKGSLATLCESIARRGDIEMAASARLDLRIPASVDPAEKTK